MDLQPNKQDAIVLPITNTRISASEWNQLVGSCMAFITAAGLTPDALDNEQFLNAFKIVAANLELIGANTNLSNLTATGEAKFTAKVDLDGSNATFPHIVETYSNGTDWYRVWSDGWCEQGGIATTSNVTLLKEMADNDYLITMTQVSGSAYAAQPLYATTTGFTYYQYQGSYSAYWKAEGYIS